SGWTGSTGGNDTSSPYSSPANYTWTSGATAPGTVSITATNQADLTASDTITISTDSTAPTGESVALSGGPYYTTASVPLTANWGSDAASWLDASSATVQRRSATLSNGTCGTRSGSFSTVTLVPGAATTVT